jgi:periplasmic protein TonB
VGSLLVHIVVVGLAVVGATFSHQIVQQATQREIVTLIAPSPDSYVLPPNKKIVSGGGGDHDPLPTPKGRLPKLAMEQITPPQIVVRNEKPRLTAEPDSGGSPAGTHGR